MYEVVELGGEHALDVALDVAEDEAVPFLTLALRFGVKLLDLETLEDRNRKVSLGSDGVCEDGPVVEKGLDGVPNLRWKLSDDATYSNAPCVICWAAIFIRLLRSTAVYRKNRCCVLREAVRYIR